ncbi:hypothetical protein PDJAM_G00205940 [Pangasius djambal]|uniref:Uncharacterized protein n=1 Tax=Pangasius djambal TaxID=1691987 RepID=A0ACC5Y8J5_9TELE|nr:hypothetical protein [Pangasius djambal]
MAPGALYLCRVWVSHIPDHPEHPNGNVTASTDAPHSDHSPFLRSTSCSFAIKEFLSASSRFNLSDFFCQRCIGM